LPEKKELLPLLLASLAVLGVFCLASAVSWFSLDEIPLEGVTLERLNQNVRIRGEIYKVHEYGNSSKLVLNDGENKVSAFIGGWFKEGGLHYKPGWCVELEGTVKLYQGELEVVVENAGRVAIFGC